MCAADLLPAVAALAPPTIPWQPWTGRDGLSRWALAAIADTPRGVAAPGQKDVVARNTVYYVSSADLCHFIVEQEPP